MPRPTHIVRIWRAREVRIFQSISWEMADDLLAFYEARGWEGHVECLERDDSEEGAS